MTPVEAAARNLEWLMRPIAPYLANPRLTDLHIVGVGDGEAFVDCGEGSQQITLPYTLRELEWLAVAAASFTKQDISNGMPLVSTKLPGGHRVQIVRDPCVPDGRFALSVRQPKKETSSPAVVEAQGVFRRTRATAPRDDQRVSRLLELHSSHRWREFLELAIASRMPIIWAGPVGTGKTHLLRAFTRAMPLDWRVMTIEDMEELINLEHRNVVNLLYSKGMQSTATVGSDDLVAAALRMGPDALFHQELRDEAAYSFMAVPESGHFGMTTTHAPTAEAAYERVLALIKSHPMGRYREDDKIRASLRKSVPVVVHCSRSDIPGEEAHRYIDQILYDPQVQANASDAEPINDFWQE